MLHEAVDRAGSEPTALREAYESLVADAIAEVGVDAAVDGTGLDRAAAEALVDGGSPTLTVGTAAETVALVGDRDADAVVAELRDALLMGMTTAVLDVDTIAANVDLDLTGQEVQQALEGRTRMTLEGLAEIQGFIEERKP